METSGLILYNEMDELKECQQKMNDMQIQMNENAPGTNGNYVMPWNNTHEIM